MSRQSRQIAVLLILLIGLAGSLALQSSHRHQRIQTVKREALAARQAEEAQRAVEVAERAKRYGAQRAVRLIPGEKSDMLNQLPSPGLGFDFDSALYVAPRATELAALRQQIAREEIQLGAEANWRSAGLEYQALATMLRNSPDPTGESPPMHKFDYDTMIQVFDAKGLQCCQLDGFDRCFDLRTCEVPGWGQLVFVEEMLWNIFIYRAEPNGQLVELFHVDKTTGSTALHFVCGDSQEAAVAVCPVSSLDMVAEMRHPDGPAMWQVTEGWCVLKLDPGHGLEVHYTPDYPHGARTIRPLE